MLQQLIDAHAITTPEADALIAPGRPSLSYRRLATHVAETVGNLTRLGIGRNDRVALVLPAGPELALALVAIAAGAIVAPLNPAYQRREFAL